MRHDAGVGTRYYFEDVWEVPQPIERVWALIDDVRTWTSWWPDYRRVELLTPELEGAVGARWRVGVKADLPYTVDFTFTVLERDPPRYVKTHVEGFFEGEIDWTLESDPAGGTRLTLRERVETRWPIINLVARLGGRRFLEGNHRAAMRRGEEGLRRELAGGDGRREARPAQGT
jgi:uncharacterized protein YndB with AHSA1/START domain